MAPEVNIEANCIAARSLAQETRECVLGFCSVAGARDRGVHDNRVGLLAQGPSIRMRGE